MAEGAGDEPCGGPPQYRHVFLTGVPGVGKTTLLRKVLRLLGSSVDARGFYTEEVNEPGVSRAAFRLVSAADPSQRQLLATLAPAPAAQEVGGEVEGSPSGHRVGPYAVHLAEFSRFARSTLPDPEGVAAAEAVSPAATRLAAIAVLDEVGAMQLGSEAFAGLVSELLGPETCCAAPGGGDGGASGQEVRRGSGCACFGTLPPEGLHSLPLVDHIRKRTDVAVVEVTSDNRDEVVDRVCKLVWGAALGVENVRDVGKKLALARTYRDELPERLDLPPRAPSAAGAAAVARFRGDHGAYELRALAGQGGGEERLTCSCPFFSRARTCSHILAVTLEGGLEELRRRRS